MLKSTPALKKYATAASGVVTNISYDIKQNKKVSYIYGEVHKEPHWTLPECSFNFWNAISFPWWQLVSANCFCKLSSSPYIKYEVANVMRNDEANTPL